METVTLLTLKIIFLSSVAVGGFITTVPELHRYVVDMQHWMTDGTFITLFALAQASPGPNFIVVTLVGWEIGGVVGATLATAAACVPTLLIAYTVSRFWERHYQSGWYRVVERALVPLAVGLILATAVLLTVSSGAGDWKKLMLTAATAAFLLSSRHSPLIPLSAAALLGVLGIV